MKEAEPLGLMPPGPASIEEMNQLRRDHKDLLNALHTCARRYGDVVQLLLPDQRGVLLNDPSDIMRVMHDSLSFEKVSNKGPVSHLIGGSLQTLSGKAAMDRRKMLNPIFHSKNVAPLSDGIAHSVWERLSHWHETEELVLGSEMDYLALHIALGYLFGEIQSDLKFQVADQFTKASQFLMDTTLERGGASSEGLKAD